MTHKDLTIIFLTVNRLPEGWVAFHKEKMFEAIGYTPVITVSAKPMPDMPGENLIQEKPFNAYNIYFQMLRAAKLVTTKYFAIIEDDSLYTREHFQHRPREDRFGYDMTRWSLFTWGLPTYHWKDRIINSSLIAPTELAIEALTERFEKNPNGIPDGWCGELGKRRVERLMNVRTYAVQQFQSTIAMISLGHTKSIDDRENRMVKRMGLLRAFDIPHWGRAEDLVKNFK